MGVILSPAAWAARGIGPLGPHTGLLATPMLHVGSPGVLLTLPGFRARERACPRALSSLVPTHPSRSPSAQHWSWTLPGGEGKEVSISQLQTTDFPQLLLKGNRTKPAPQRKQPGGAGAEGVGGLRNGTHWLWLCLHWSGCRLVL